MLPNNPVSNTYRSIPTKKDEQTDTKSNDNTLRNFLDEHPTIKLVLANIVKVSHLLFCAYIWFGVYLIEDPLHLSIFLCLILILITHWYVFGGCALTPIENYLSNNDIRDEKGLELSFITQTINNFLGSNRESYYITTLYTLFVGIFAVYKLYRIKSCRRR